MADRTVVIAYTASTAQYESAVRKMGGTTRDFAKGVEDSQQRTRRSFSSTLDYAKRNEQAFNTIGIAAVAMGGAIALGLKQAFDASMRFESAFAGVRKTVDASEAEFDRLSAGIRQMALDIPVSAEEIAGIGEAAGQLGISTEHILGFSRTMADLGVATNLSSEEAATSLARLANITQMPQTEFDRLGSTVVALGNNFATTESEIVDMGLRLAGAGAQIGLTESDILALSTALSSVGINAEAGGSAISRVMMEIASQVETSGDKLEDFAAVAGMSADEFTVAWREDAAGALVTFIEGLGNMEAQGGSTLQTLEDLEITEIRMRDALLRSAGAGDLMREALELGNVAWAENNALTKEAEERYGTTESRIQMARNAVNDLMISVGDALSPVVGGAADAVGGLASALSGLPDPLLGVGAGLAGLTSAAALGGGALLLMLPKIADIRDAFQRLNITKATTLTRMRSVARFMTGPWGAALAVGATALWQFMDRNRRATQQLESLREAMGDVAPTVQSLSDELILAELRAAGVDGAFFDLGVSLETVRQALLGNAEADRVVQQALMDSYGLAEEYSDALSRVTGGLVGSSSEARELHRVLEAMQTAVERQTDAVSGANREWVNAAEAGERHTRVLHLLRGGSRDAASATDDLAASAAGAVDDLAAMGDEALATVEDVEELTDAQSRLQSALLNFSSPIGIYQDLLREKEEAERKSAEETAAATKSAEDSWEDFYTTQEVSLAEYAQRLEESNAAHRNWRDNLLEVARRGSADVAMILADMGEEGVELTAKMADGTDEEFNRMADALIEHSGRAADDSVRNLERGFEVMEVVGRLGADATVSAIAEELDIGTGEVARVLRRYSGQLGGAIKPILDAIGDARSAQALQRYISGERITGLNTGGLVPGSGPDRDSVLIGATPGEFMWSRKAVETVGVDALEQAHHLARHGRRNALEYLFGGDPSSPGLAFQGLNAGGRVLAGQAWASRQAGKPYIWGGVGPRGYDCSGAISALTNVILGRERIHQRLFSTASFAGGHGAAGFRPGLGSAFGIGVVQGRPGHMAATLGGLNVESRGSAGFVVGGRARGATDPLFNQRFHLPQVGGFFIPGGLGASWDLPEPPSFPYNGIAESAMGASKTMHGKAKEWLHAGVFDTGGFLQPGFTLAYNGTGMPEPVGINYERLGEALRGHGDVKITQHITKADPAAVMQGTRLALRMAG